jgi:uncharacterized protein
MHLLGPIPGVNILAPTVLWFMKKDNCPYLDAVGKEAINFQIIVTALILLATATCVGWVFVPLMAFAGAVSAVIAAYGISQGRFYRYPFTIRFL